MLGPSYKKRFMLLFSAYLGQLCPKQPTKLNNKYRYYGNGYADPVLQTQYIEVNTKTYHTVNYFQIIQVFNQMTRRNHLIESTVRTKGCLTYINILLMAISNDVQLNPGPTNNDSTIYGCGTCTQPVTWDHRAVVCDTCDQWYHISCQEIRSETYSILNEADNIIMMELYKLQ